MKLTPEQQHVVENNMGLVGKVIKNKVHGIDQLGCFTYDDLFQIGCIGLCKAAATDKGGCFSTYAYRVIWNEICDVLIQATRHSSREQLLVHSDYRDELSMAVLDQLKSGEVRALLSQTIAAAPERIANGIRCLLLAEEGYSSKELGQMFCAEPATVRMWMTKARRYLQEQPELADYWKES